MRSSSFFNFVFLWLDRLLRACRFSTKLYDYIKMGRLYYEYYYFIFVTRITISRKEEIYLESREEKAAGNLSVM